MPSLPTRIDRFEIKRLIGRGGMGELYLAHDPNTGRLVAVKVLSATEDSQEFRARFVREARALAALNHPNIVRIYDTGEFEGSPFIVMEYVRGETVEAMIRRRAPLPVPAKLGLMMELCAGLAQAHQGGIIHRDIKPANLIVDEQGRLRILDFGIARVVNDNRTIAAAPLTQLNIALGTPGYMAPEQIEGGQIDHRADIFAVGAVCYELLSFSPAFPGTSIEQVERNVLAAKPAPLASLVPDLDAEVDEVVLRALNREPDKRYPDAATFGQALGRVRDRLGSQTLAQGTPEAPTEVRAEPPTEIAPQSPPAQPPPAAGRRWRSVRAEAAYRRALEAQRTGALDAARRFAAEAVAEDPSYADARELLTRLGARSRQEPAGGLAPTIAATRVGDVAAPPGAAPTIISPWADQPRASSGSAATIIVDPGETRVPTGGETKVTPRPPAGREGWFKRLVARTASPPGDRRVEQPFWIRYRALLLVGGLLLLMAIMATVVWIGLRWLQPSGQLLTIQRPVGGTLSADGIRCGTDGTDCRVTRPDGEIVELVATPDPGYVLQSYLGDCAPSGRTTMGAPRTCGATFVPVTDKGGGQATQVLTVAPVPTGGTLMGVYINCGSGGSQCSGEYPEGADEQLKPMPDAGYTFTGWTGDCARDGRLTMSGPHTCSATFGPITITTTVPVVPPRRNVGADKLASAEGSGRGQGRAEVPTQTTVPPPPPPGAGTGTPGGQVPVAPAGPPPAPPPSPEEYAKSRIKELLQEWCAAYRNVDPERVLALYPNENAASLRMNLNKQKYVSVECKVGDPQYLSLDAAAGTAKIEVEITRVYQHTIATKKKETSELVATVTLLRPAERLQWRIESATYRPK